MLIQNTAYPSPSSYEAQNSGFAYLKVNFTGLGAGRRLRAIDGTVVGPGYDNVFLKLNGGSPSYLQEFNNPNQTVVINGDTTGTADEFWPSGPGSSTSGTVTFRLQIETGVATDIYENVSSALHSFTFDILGDPGLVASDYGAVVDPEAPACFWTDLVRVEQPGCVIALDLVQLHFDNNYMYDYAGSFPDGILIGDGGEIWFDTDSDAWELLYDSEGDRFYAVPGFSGEGTLVGTLSQGVNEWPCEVSATLS